MYKLFDTLILLSRGSVLYCGPADRAIPYFLAFPEYAILTPSNSTCNGAKGDVETGVSENPVDFLLRVSISQPAISLIRNSDAYNAAVNFGASPVLKQDPITEPVTDEHPSYQEEALSSSPPLLKFFFIHGWVVFERSFRVFYKGWLLLLSATFLHICFALIFPISMGDTSDDEYGKLCR